MGELGGLVYTNARIHRYLTYQRKPKSGKSVDGTEVKPNGIMLYRKMQALLCYRSQIIIDALGCWPHFMDLREFEA